jgi:hypothetical protein
MNKHLWVENNPHWVTAGLAESNTDGNMMPVEEEVWPVDGGG